MTQPLRSACSSLAVLTVGPQASGPARRRARPEEAAPVCPKPRPATLGALTPLTSWASLAPGVWRATAGDTSRELRYTDFAAAPPRLEACARGRSGISRSRPNQSHSSARPTARLPSACRARPARNSSASACNWTASTGTRASSRSTSITGRPAAGGRTRRALLRVQPRLRCVHRHGALPQGDTQSGTARTPRGIRRRSIAIPARRTRAALGFAAGIRRGRVPRGRTGRRHRRGRRRVGR